MSEQTLTPAQQAQVDNRDHLGQFTTRTHTDVEDTSDVLGLTDEANEQEVEQPREIRYSFLKEFKLAEEKFDTEFEGIPNRFYNADLRGKHLSRAADGDLEAYADSLAEPGSRAGQYFDHRGLTGKLCYTVSAPDENKISDERAVELIEDLDHVTEVRPIENEPLLRTMDKNASRGWLARMEHITERGDREERWLAVSDHPMSSLKTFTLRAGSGPVHPHQMVTQTDLRSVVGDRRIARRTGESLIGRTAMHPYFDFSTMDYPDDHPEGYSHASYQQRVYALKEAGTSIAEERQARQEINDVNFSDTQIAAVRAVATLEDAQLEGRNFIAQRKHLKNTGGKVATAFDDKKNPDKTRQDMMAKTSLAAANGGIFSKVEIDNDVDPEEYADFESAISEVESKLPAMPEARRPDLRIRKLGKHNANGIFSPSRNTVAVDVRTSEAYIHEMGHYYDFVAKDNASLSHDFRSISRSYASSLNEPDSKRKAYLNTPTEQMARGFEVYAVERLGINNRLVNPSKFDRSDYTPYTENPELKQRTFAFFDKLFSDEG